MIEMNEMIPIEPRRDKRTEDRKETVCDRRE